MTTNKTLDLDKLFVRDIYFKDYSNRPISANKILTTRGDGGIYFGNPYSGETYPAFNELRAGSNTVVASNIYNKLWFEEGAGIKFHTIIDGLQPKTFIAATGPEQISLVKSGESVNFSSLQESVVGGRTLFFDYTGDATVNISDTTIIFGTAYNSSYSSLSVLTSTTLSLQSETSTIQGIAINNLSTVNALLISTTISTFYSTLLYTTNVAEELSTFIFSTLHYGPEGGTVLSIGEVNAVSISTGTITVPTMITTDMNIGSNLFNDMNLVGSNADSCTAYLSTGIASTFTNYFKVSDSYTNAVFAIEKERIFTESTFGLSSLQTIGNQVQIGWFPQLSTQSGSLPPATRENFAPILLQTEIMEKTVEGGQSTLTRYILKNVAKLDEICAKDELEIRANNVIINTLTVDTINSINPFKSEIISTFSTIYISSGFATNMTVSTLFNSTLRAHNIRSNNISSGYISTTEGHVSSLTYDIAVGHINYNNTTSTINLEFDIATGNGVSTNYISTSNILYSSSFGNSLTVVKAQYVQADGQYLSTQFIGYGTASGNILYADKASTTTLVFGTASGSTLYADMASTTTFGYGTASGNILYANNASTTTLGFGTASGANMIANSISSHTISSLHATLSNLDVSTIRGNTLTTSNISAIYISTNAIQASSISLQSANMYQAYISDLWVSSIHDIPYISSFSTFYISTGQIINGTISSLTLSTIMGVDSPIFTFDMQNRRVGLNLGNNKQPRATLDISGIVYANNFVTTSDRRLKSNIEPLICDTIPRGYRYTQESGEMDIGVMADELEQIAPECIYTRPDGYKAVSYMKLVPVCLTLIQSLSDRLAALEAVHKV